jgi:hypothetical protein
MAPKVQSRWPKTSPPAEARPVSSGVKAGAKKVASKALDATGPGVGIGTTASGSGAIALATGAAAASATGIGLVVVGTLATVGASAKAVVAARSSKRHRDALEKLQERWREMPCMVPPESDGDEPDIAAHHRIAYYVLPYAIEQKNKKYHRKAVGAVPVLGTAPMAIRQVYRAATKEHRGEQRSQMAYELAVHLVTHNCALAQGIVSELYSYEKMLWMLDQDSDVLTPLLMTKLAST